MQKPVLASDAVWKQRFRAPALFLPTIAWNNPSRGSVLSNESGVRQLYAWDIPKGTLAPVTSVPTGVLLGTISVDGNYLYYMQDKEGNETGHFVRIPFEGGEPEDLTPDLDPYSGYFVMENRAGGTLGLLTANKAGKQIYTIQ